MFRSCTVCVGGEESQTFVECMWTVIILVEASVEALQIPIIRHCQLYQLLLLTLGSTDTIQHAGSNLPFLVRHINPRHHYVITLI